MIGEGDAMVVGEGDAKVVGMYLQFGLADSHGGHRGRGGRVLLG